jgi:hypothetical protein
MARRRKNYRPVLRAMFPGVSNILVGIIKRENTKTPKLPKWREKQLARLIKSLNMMASELDRAEKLKMLPTLAWAARSLLELWVWVEYCCKSQENARRFHDDAVRDLFGISRASIAIIRHETGTDDMKIRAVIDNVARVVKRFGIEQLSDDFKRVSAAARELGKEELFLAQNKFYSKLAHPTAFAVGSPSSEKIDRSIRALIFSDGVHWGRQSIRYIRDLILVTFPKPGHEHELNF